MKRNPFIVVAFTLGLGMPAASLAGPSIQTQAAPGANFGAYKTYTWVQANLPSDGNPITYQQIVNDVDGALAQKGYQKAPSGGDLSLIITIGTKDKTDVESWGRFGLQTSVWQYTEGQLSLDAFDTKTQLPVWHGHATQTIDPGHVKPEKVDAAVMKLMAQFPANAATPPQQ